MRPHFPPRPACPLTNPSPLSRALHTQQLQPPQLEWGAGQPSGAPLSPQRIAVACAWRPGGSSGGPMAVRYAGKAGVLLSPRHSAGDPEAGAWVRVIEMKATGADGSLLEKGGQARGGLRHAPGHAAFPWRCLVPLPVSPRLRGLILLNLVRRRRCQCRRVPPSPLPCQLLVMCHPQPRHPPACTCSCRPPVYYCARRRSASPAPRRLWCSRSRSRTWTPSSFPACASSSRPPCSAPSSGWPCATSA